MPLPRFPHFLLQNLEQRRVASAVSDSAVTATAAAADTPEAAASDDDDDEEDDNDDDKEEQNQSTCRFKDALVCVTDENMDLHCLVDDLLQRNKKQGAVMQQLTVRVDYLEEKLLQLGRKHRRSRHAGGEEGRRDTEAPTTSSSSSSAGEGHPDHDEVCCSGVDAERIIDCRDGGWDQRQQ